MTDGEVNVHKAYTTTVEQKEQDLATGGSNYQAATLLATGKSGEHVPTNIAALEVNQIHLTMHKLKPGNSATLRK